MEVSVLPSSSADFSFSFILDISVMIPELVVSQKCSDSVSDDLQITVLSLTTRECMLFLHDGARLHSSLTVTGFWNNKYPRCRKFRWNYNMACKITQFESDGFYVWGHLQSVALHAATSGCM
jgi:hypothetical protein